MPPIARAPIAALIALLSLAGTASAQQAEAPVALSCTLSVLCVDVGPCRDWDQTLTIREGAEGWQVNWNDSDLPSDYELIADLPAPEDAMVASRVRSLLYRNTATQSVQMLSFDSAGTLTVSGQQPHANTRIVTGVGTCEDIVE